MFLASSLTNVLLIAAWFCTYSYFADFLGKVKGMNEERISYMLLVFGLAGIPANWIAGRLLEGGFHKPLLSFYAGLCSFLLSAWPLAEGSW